MKFKVLGDNNNQLFGGKFDNLNFLFKNKLKVPKTFVINEKHLDFKEILNLYEKYIKSEFYIVRSSCGVEDGKKLSYAGLFCSISGKISDNLIEKNIKKVILSKNNKSILLYEKYLIGESIEKNMNVIIQEYIFGDFSGVYFSNLDGKKVMSIIYGGNKFLVDGEENSTNVYLDENFEILNKEIGFQKRKLGENFNIFFVNKNIEIPDNIFNLIINNIKIAEKLFNYSIDVEFTIKNNEFYFLQVRPITI